jgi:hypothetical protein
MASQAIERLNNCTWIHQKFAEFVTGTFGEIEYAVEVHDSKRITLYFICGNVLNIVSTPLIDRVEFKISTKEYPLKFVKKLHVLYGRIDPRPDEPIDIEKIGLVASLVFSDDTSLDLALPESISAAQIADLRNLIQQIRNIIQSF